MWHLPIQPREKTLKTFSLALCDNKHHRIRLWTLSQLKNRRMSNNLMDVDCWNLTDHRSFPTTKNGTYATIVHRAKLRKLTKCIIPAAVNHTDMKIETNWASLMELEVLSILRYWRISGTVINRKARRNRKPAKRSKSYNTN